MRSAIRTAAPLTLFLAACTTGPSDFTEMERQAVAGEIAVAVEDLTEAMNAGDAEAVLSFYRDSEDFTYLGCTEYILGGATFARIVTPYYDADRDEVFELGIVRTIVLGPDAAAVSLRGRSSSEPALFWTQIWVREGSRWVVALEHESWPGCREPSASHPMTSATDSAGVDEGR